MALARFTPVLPVDTPSWQAGPAPAQGGRSRCRSHRRRSQRASKVIDRKSLAVKFERHAREEGNILSRYRVLAEQLGDSEVGSLISHIMAEEEQHHLLLCTMGKWLREPARR